MYKKLSEPGEHNYPFNHRIGDRVQIAGVAETGTILEGHFSGAENAGAYEIAYDVQIGNNIVRVPELDLKKIRG